MNKNNTKKLALRRTTVRKLEGEGLGAAHGGIPRLTFGMDCPTANCMTLGQYCVPTNNCLTLGMFCTLGCSGNA